ncbi:Phytochrome-like protein cph1 [Hartmannibacter diazotrophicus]|uniref:histidine kinase n=1 Tax=Hartmannibacter diazotrophicus TaxID=1482074 RepID=A0A2C9D7G3_9HYPH|nr:PAS domain S-box protein [Hartmannibacter diazotrophicus]SON56088.1 Phytochrome-like protein cph1 [Hartmannibacter diazotrophicus]
MGLWWRLTAAMAMLVVITAGIIGFIGFRTLESTVYPRALARLNDQARFIAGNLDMAAEQARGDILAKATTPAVAGIVRASANGGIDPETGHSLDTWRRMLADDLTGELTAKPNYLQYRLIGVAGDGREIVRVERGTGEKAVIVIRDEDLQSKGDRDYFLSTIGLQAGAIAVSRIELNREHGEVMVPHTPVLRLSTPILEASGRPFGILIINIDMRSVFDAQRGALGPQRELFVTNAEGDYLVAPEGREEFAFEFGRQSRIQDDFAAIGPVLDNQQPLAAIVTRSDGQEYAVAAVPQIIGSVHPIVVVDAVPKEVFADITLAPAVSSLKGALFVILPAVLAAAFLARSLTRPLSRITNAAEGLAEGRLTEVPTDAGGEIGVLARAFDAMQQETAQKTAALSKEVEEHRATIGALRRKSEQESLLSAAVESSEDAIVLLDLDGRITHWNPACQRLYGYSADEVLGQTLRFLTPPDRVHESDLELESIREGASIDNLETIRLAKSGAEINVQVSVWPVRLTSGELIGAAKLTRDMTYRRQEEERFRLAIEASPSGMVMTDAEGLIVLVNAETERLFGFSREELIGQRVETLLPAEKRSDHPALRHGYLKHPGRRNMGVGRDLYACHKNGSEFPVEVGLNPIQTQGGMMILAVIIDITERKRAEEAIEATTMDLRRSNAELEQFAYIAAHDLQEPLRMVASYTELLSQRYSGQLDERADKYIDYAVDGAKRMKLLISDLLVYSRVGTQGKPPEPVESGRIVETVVHSMQSMIEDAGATVHYADLPLVEADQVQLGQLFQNLISNAIKFRRDEPPRVEIRTERRDGGWLFVVADNGIGMDSKYSDRIFQMFQRLHERGRYPGSGIGLAITKKIVERHGGRIWFESKEGEGTTFYFTLNRVERGSS